MSPISFELLINAHPNHRRAFRKLESWLNAHEDLHIIDASRIAKDLRDLSPVTLATALTLAVNAGLLRRTYKVLTPGGVMADGEFDDPRTIPPTLPDRFERYFDTTEADVVPVFRRVA